MDVATQIDALESQIDTLTSTLQPLLSTPLTQQLTTLPLLDKAKLHILLTYSIESLLFSSLQLSGQDARTHAIFSELARLRTYFAKVKDAEEAEKGPRMRVDKEAAARFVRAGLAGNSSERVGVHKKFEEEKDGGTAAESKKEKGKDRPDRESRREQKKQKRLERAKAAGASGPNSNPEREEELVVPQKPLPAAPKTSSEMFNALLSGGVEGKGKSKGNGKKKSKGK